MLLDLHLVWAQVHLNKRKSVIKFLNAIDLIFSSSGFLKASTKILKTLSNPRLRQNKVLASGILFDR